MERKNGGQNMGGKKKRKGLNRAVTILMCDYLIEVMTNYFEPKSSI